MPEIQSEADFFAALEDSPEPVEQVQENQPEATSSGDDQTRATEPGLFHGIDPESLTPEMRSMFDNMQRTYTQRSQEIAPLRKMAEQFGGVNEIQEALNFVTALKDPKNLVQLHSELSDYLQANGLTKEEADAAASSQIAANTDDDDEDFGFSDPNDDLRRQLDELKGWKEQMEQERLQAEIEADLARKEAAIRQANPSYTDDDINAIYRFAYAFGGDLEAAQTAFEGERQRILSSYSQEKAEVPSGVTSPDATGGAEAPPSFDDWEARHRYAKSELEAYLNNNVRL